MPERENEIGNDTTAKKIDFKAFTASLYMSAAVSMGLLPDPITNEKRRNLEFAQETIEILKMLREKTKGNLTDDENGFLNDCIYRLMLAFVEAARGEDKKA
ncbi:MAG: DUF1844 domain-containing protein [Deltaproteobacteria bacterium]|nr:DUF1844 domain-containing protein [Deltaproteobacteria bacterium]